MPLWAAAVLLIACVGGAMVFMKRYVKSKQARFLALTAAMVLLALALLGYAVLTLLLLAGVG